MHHASSVPTTPDPASNGLQPLKEILTFRVGGEEFGIDILQVQEIRGYAGVTRLPDTPAWVKGVINLRGAIVPVIDLRIKLHGREPSYSDNTCMVVVTLGDNIAGLVVDAVCDVTGLAAGDVRQAPPLGSGVHSAALQGIATQGDRMIILLDLPALLDGALPELATDLATAA